MPSVGIGKVAMYTRKNLPEEAIIYIKDFLESRDWTETGKQPRFPGMRPGWKPCTQRYGRNDCVCSCFPLRYKGPVFQNHSQTNPWKEEASIMKRSFRFLVCCL